MSKAETKSVSETRLNLLFDTLESELVSHAGTAATPATDYAIDRLFSRCRKKARYERPDLEIKTEETFLSINRSLDPDVFSCDINPLILSNARLFVAVTLERFTKSLVPESIQESLDYGVLLDRWRFGPGASNGIRGSHPAEKIDQDWTVTSSCKPLVMLLRKQDADFRAFDERAGTSLVEVQGSRFETVPKNQDTLRPIAVEPLGNMVLQLAAGQYIADALRCIGLDITKQQPKNKLLARLGSIHGKLATIDLSSASDRISVELVRLLMPAKWFKLLMALRSPHILVRGEWVVANMISTMGNGFTFALMTLLLTSLIYGFRAVRGGPNLYIDWSCTAVYGDDIIIKTAEYAPFICVLESAGLVVNVDKSYSEGPFRESCGGDYWNGIDVTPFYVKSLACDADVYVAMNQLLTWMVNFDLCFPQTLSMLHGFLEGGLFLVPEWMQAYQGVQTQDAPRRFKYLEYVPQKRKYRGFFALKLAVGGYVVDMEPDKPAETSRLDVTVFGYVPRSRKIRYQVRKARIPQGYLNGWDAVERSQAASKSRAFWVRCMGIQ